MLANLTIVDDAIEFDFDKGKQSASTQIRIAKREGERRGAIGS